MAFGTFTGITLADISDLVTAVSELGGGCTHMYSAARGLHDVRRVSVEQSSSTNS